MRLRFAVWACAGAALVLSGCNPQNTGDRREASGNNSAAQDNARSAAASGGRIEMVDAKGNRVGDVTLASHTDGVRLTGDLHDLPPGTHGTHIHSVGRCDPPDFKSAGDHFNPAAKQHGDQNPQGAHAGDLGNITIGQDGKGQFEVIAKGVTIEAGAASLARPGGTSLVIHAREDDRKSDPSGNSGERIACGVFASASGGPR